MGLLQSRIHKQMLSVKVYNNLSVTHSLRVMLMAHPPIKEFQAHNIVDTCFAAVSYAARVTFYRTWRISPGIWLVFPT